jgi:hypothetical protein
MFTRLLERLKPVCESDNDEWEALKAGVGAEIRPLVWYASSGLDLTPVVAAVAEIEPLNLVEPVFVMSDYAQSCLDVVKRAYDRLDEGEFDLLSRWDREYSVWPSFRLDNDTQCETLQWHVHLVQMIPLTLWSEANLEDFKAEFATLTKSKQSKPVSCEAWHVIFMLLRVKRGKREVDVPAFFVAAENLLVFREIFKEYKLPIEIFLAVRVGSKGGSWDSTHDFEHGHLPRAIMAEREIRPKIWGYDTANSRDDSTALPPGERVTRIQGMGYGEGCTFRRLHWDDCDKTTIVYADGRIEHIANTDIRPETCLAKACHDDDLIAVKSILSDHPEVDVNATVKRGLRHHGTPLVLTGSVDIARLLVERGAEVERACEIHGRTVTPLMSAERDRNSGLIDYFRSLMRA